MCIKQAWEIVQKFPDFRKSWAWNSKILWLSCCFATISVNFRIFQYFRKFSHLPLSCLIKVRKLMVLRLKVILCKHLTPKLFFTRKNNRFMQNLGNGGLYFPRITSNYCASLQGPQSQLNHLFGPATSSKQVPQNHSASCLVG